MAIFNNGFHSGFSGKLGPIVGYQLNGKWVIRSLPKISKKNKKGTSAQQACRRGFTQMQYFLRPFIPVLRVGFKLEAQLRMMSAHNAAKSYNMRQAQTADGKIDEAKICLTYGLLLPAQNPAVTIQSTGFLFTWHSSEALQKRNATDQAILVAYQAQSDVVYHQLNGPKRETGSAFLAIPDEEKGNDFHTWLSFIAKDGKSIAMSNYLGRFVFE